MNIGLLTSTFFGNVGADLPPSRPIPAENRRQFDPFQAENPYIANAPESTTDNTFTLAQNECLDRPPQEFRYTLRKQTMTEGPQNEQNPTSPKSEQPGVVQRWLANYPLIEHGNKGVARKMEPKAGYQLAQLIANLRTGRFPLGKEITNKPVAKEPLLTIDKGRLGLKGVLPDISGDTLVKGNQLAERNNAVQIQISNKAKALITTKGLISQKSGKELAPEVLTADGKTIPAGEKPAVADKSTASGTQKIPVLNGKKLTTETPTTGSKTAVIGEKTNITDQQAVSDGNKMPLSNDSFPEVQDKATATRQKVPVEPEKSDLGPQKLEQGSRGLPDSVENKRVFNSETSNDDTPRLNHPGTPGLSELIDDIGKEQAKNPSGKLLLQNLNPAQVKVSTGKAKDRSSSTFNNSSNPNPEQVLSNNAQSPILEQTSASAPTAKASPGNAFTSVSEQLQESIQSSLSQREQQLTIQLNPPELGRVFIKFQEQGDQITGLLEVDKAQTRYEIEHALPQLIRNLADCGVQIKRLEVVLANQQEQYAFKDTSLAAEQDGWAGQQAGAERNNPNLDTFGTNEWLTDGQGYSGYSESQEMLIADDFVDVLV